MKGEKIIIDFGSINFSHCESVYGHLQRPGLCGLPKFRPLVAKPFAPNPHAATFLPFAAQLFAAGHSQRNRTFAAKIGHLQVPFAATFYSKIDNL